MNILILKSLRLLTPYSILVFRICRKFRENLREYIAKNNIFISIPQKYLHIFEYHYRLSGFQGLRTKSSSSNSPNTDLLSSNSVKVTGNILTYLLMPLHQLFKEKYYSLRM